MKPMLAEDYIEEKLKFPLIAQVKTDGVRGLHITGKMTGRSLKSHKNLHTTARFSDPRYAWLDGELFRGPVSNMTSKSLCRDTTSDLNTIKGTPEICWMVFDLLTERTIKLPYKQRLMELCEHVVKLGDTDLVVVPSIHIETLEELYEYEAWALEQGYEGLCLRDPNGLPKSGRSTPTEGGLLRIKRFVDAEATVLRLIEGNSNENEAVVNELGRTERSSHQENMVPNGLVGALECLEHTTGLTITVSAGCMDAGERKFYFENPHLIVGQDITFTHFPKGRKVLPRFPNFKCVRSKENQS